MAKSKHRPKHKKALQGYQQLRQDALAAYAATQPREVAKGMWKAPEVDPEEAPEHDGESYIVGVDPAVPGEDKTVVIDYLANVISPAKAQPGDTYLLTNQTDPAKNGVYKVDKNGRPRRVQAKKGVPNG